MYVLYKQMFCCLFLVVNKNMIVHMYIKTAWSAHLVFFFFWQREIGETNAIGMQ